MDAARYMAPALQNFAKMIIPLSEPVPRRLIVTTPKPRSSSRSSSANPSQRNSNQGRISTFMTSHFIKRFSADNVRLVLNPFSKSAKPPSAT